MDEPRHRPATLQDYHERMLRVLVHIQQHLDEAVGVEELARVACLSPYHFLHVFRGMVGESLMEHVRRLRLERAAQQLRYGRQPVTRIAFQAGYETHEAFTRAFKGMFGCAPSVYREAHLAAVPPQVACGVHYDPEARVQFLMVRSGELTMDVRIEKREPLRVAFMRQVGPYQQAPETWQRFMKWAGPRGLLNSETVCLAICHDNPEVTPQELVRYDACINVPDSFEPEGEVGVQIVPGGLYAVATHRGPYERLGEAYAWLCGQWLPSSGHTSGQGPPFEVYHSGPETPPEQIVTELFIPLAS